MTTFTVSYCDVGLNDKKTYPTDLKLELKEKGKYLNFTENSSLLLDFLVFALNEIPLILKSISVVR